MHKYNKNFRTIETLICPVCGRGLPVGTFLKVVPTEPHIILQQCMGRKGFKKIGKRALSKRLLTALKGRIRFLYSLLCCDEEEVFPNICAQPDVEVQPNIGVCPNVSIEVKIHG